MDAVSLYSTWPDMKSAEAAARALIERRLAACANIIPGAVSLYQWGGALQRDEEIVMLAKTQAARANAARDALIELHPYDLPCVLALPLNAEGSSTAFTNWIAEQTGDAGSV